MCLLSRVIFAVILQTATGNYCSQSDTKIDCDLCERCMRLSPKCYFCPMKCGKQNNCETVCAPKCRNGTCEHFSDSAPVCTQGCVEGFTGQQCREYCSNGCKECDQKSGKCVSCLEGFIGENCNIAIIDSTSAAPSPPASLRECATECDFCNDTGTVCEKCSDVSKCEHPCGCNGLQLTTDHKQFPPTSPSEKDFMNTHPQTTPHLSSTLFSYKLSIMSAALSATVAVAAVLVICIAVICYRKRSLHRLVISRPCGRDRTNNCTDGSSFAYTGYTYMDETNLGSCHDQLNERPINVPHCYEEMGNGLSLGEEDTGSELSVSAWSGTLFGNLFKVDNESDTQSHLTISEGQLNEKENIDLVEVYEMNCLKYITPEVTLNANQGASNV